MNEGKGFYFVPGYVFFFGLSVALESYWRLFSFVLFVFGFWVLSSDRGRTIHREG